jgi:hypothetical protein
VLQQLMCDAGGDVAADRVGVGALAVAQSPGQKAQQLLGDLGGPHDPPAHFLPRDRERRDCVNRGGATLLRAGIQHSNKPNISWTPSTSSSVVLPSGEVASSFTLPL